MMKLIALNIGEVLHLRVSFVVNKRPNKYADVKTSPNSSVSNNTTKISYVKLGFYSSDMTF